METEYWIIINEQPSGPYTRPQLEQMQGLTLGTMVWYEALTDWIPLSQVAALQDLCVPSVPSGDASGMPPVPADEIPPVPAPASGSYVSAGDVPATGSAACCEAPADGPAAEVVCMPRRPANYLAWSIISIVLFFPTGIVALLFSLGVNKRHKRGDYEGALSRSERAQWWIIISIVLGLVFYPIRAVTLGF